ncbi:NAD kinase b isoform X1 [Acipenser oxyrinchus oxyrinchus]|uniref:NAD(+) kinase n=1 Tax=Acipenser oxyrinchus oxyrinchus TaxID=40147 RepID=A0AAD8D301_ACIOX|nr:NAD kinase b isoform X1 [Acipenser oxyrinchus oxyrinchus]
MTACEPMERAEEMNNFISAAQVPVYEQLNRLSEHNSDPEEDIQPHRRQARREKVPKEPMDVKIPQERNVDQEQVHRSRDEQLPGRPENTTTESPKRWDRCRRGHFLHGPYPATHFGPKACILPNPTSVMHIQDPASQRLTWSEPPVNVLVIKKIRDESLLEPFKQLCRFLVEEKQLVVYVEKKVVEDSALSNDEAFHTIRNQLCSFREGYDDISKCIDLIVCLGGDGTLLYASSLFQGSVPPVMAFHLGSLGFLTPFKFESYKTEVTKVFEGNAAIVLRSRLKVKVVKDIKHVQESVNKYKVEENGLVPQSHTDKEAGTITIQLQALNEVVVDRGPSSYLSNVDLYLDGRLITSVQGDGVIVSTPTGSTAYAAAAGASMIHPNVPAIMVTPICPHSLSFRPIVVPAGVELMIMLSPDARTTAWVSFDGRKRQEIQHGDRIKITTSCYPVPSICCHDLVYDWFESLAECLHWNVRKKQTRLSDSPNSSDTEN